jgi:hypothetical protein
MTSILSSTGTTIPVSSSSSSAKKRYVPRQHPAIQRQNKLHANYIDAQKQICIDQTAILHAIQMLNVGRMTVEESSSGSGSSGEPNDLVQSSHARMRFIYAQAAEFYCALLSAEKLLTDNERNVRLSAFREDFWPNSQFDLVAHAEPVECMLCCEKRTLTTTFPCNSDARVCRACLESTAFESSAQGTKIDGYCPFCRASFTVYEQRRTKRTRRERDSN